MATVTNRRLTKAKAVPDAEPDYEMPFEERFRESDAESDAGADAEDDFSPVGGEADEADLGDFFSNDGEADANDDAGIHLEAAKPGAKSLPEFADPVEALHWGNSKLSEQLTQMMQSNSRPRLERLLKSLMGDESAQQWLMQVDYLLKHQAEQKERIVQQVLSGSLGLKL